MRWAYLPTLLVLAVCYTKINSPANDEKQNPIYERKLASLTSAPTGPATLAKISPTILYQHLNDSDFVNMFKPLADFQGTVVGNPQVESFGFVVNDKSKPIFSINDFSEAGPGVLYHDVLLHLVSAKMLDKKMSWEKYFEAYKLGLQNQPYTYSYYTEKGLDSAIWSTQKMFEEISKAHTPFGFSKFKKNHKQLELTAKNSIQNSLKKKFPQIQLIDSYESDSDRISYQLLVRIRPQDKIQLLELVESGQSTYEQTFNKEEASLFSERFKEIKLNIFDEQLDGSLDLAQLDKKEYILKFADNFSSKLHFADVPQDDYHDIILDEAYVLGFIHGNSLQEGPNAYIKAWATIPAALIDEKMIEFKYRLSN